MSSMFDDDSLAARPSSCGDDSCRVMGAHPASGRLANERIIKAWNARSVMAMAGAGRLDDALFLPLDELRIHIAGLADVRAVDDLHAVGPGRGADRVLHPRVGGELLQLGLHL